MSNDKKIIIMEDNTEIKVSDKHECVSVIFEEYCKYDVSMSEVLASVEIRGFSAEDVVDIYAECVKQADSDTMVRFFEEIDNDELDKICNEDCYFILGL